MREELRRRPRKAAMSGGRRPSGEQKRHRMSREEALAAQEKRKRIEERTELGKELARGPIDLPFFLLVLLLTGIGLLMLLSASFPSAYHDPKIRDPIYFFFRQALFAGAGVAVMLFIGKIDYHRFRAFSNILLIVSVILLFLVLIPGIGQLRNGARRWIGVGELFTFQPSEIAKVAVVLYFADTISKKKDKMRSFREGILPYGVVLVIICLLVVKEPHVSGAVLILGAGAILMLVGGINWGWVLGGLGIVGGIGYFIVGVVGYNSSRMEMWHNPWVDARGKGYQLCQSLISIGSGGLLGVGLGKGRQKFMFLPEEHNDFIFAIVCEELGLIGASLIMLLFAALVLRGYWIALNARDRFGSLLVVGMVSLIAMQVFLNIGVVTGLLPTTGISLPFFSYGGTALLMQLAEMGVVLSVSRQMKPPRAG